MHLSPRQFWHVLGCISIIVLGLVTTACSTPSSPKENSTTTGGNPTPTSTAKQATLPTVSSAFCQMIVSPDQANQIFHESGQNAISTVDASATICMYDNAANVPVVSITFMGYDAGAGPLSQIASNTASFNCASDIVTQQITSLGDQASYISCTTSSGKANYLFVLKGGVYFIINVGPDSLINSPTDAVAMSEFQQIAQLVLKQL